MLAKVEFRVPHIGTQQLISESAHVAHLTKIAHDTGRGAGDQCTTNSAHFTKRVAIPTDGPREAIAVHDHGTVHSLADAEHSFPEVGARWRHHELLTFELAADDFWRAVAARNGSNVHACNPAIGS